MEEKTSFKIINAKQLKKKIDSEGNFVLVDVLGKESYEKNHIPKSINIPVAEEDFENKVKEKLSDKNKPVIVYCASKVCLASPSAAKKLVEMGYNDVTDFEGGLKEWQEAGYSATPKESNTCSKECSCC